MINLMIVDDEIEILKNLRKCIDWKTWGITLAAEASNAVEGLAKARECRPDILICDIHMPGKDGLVFCAELKSFLPQLKIIVLSGYNDPQYLHRALKLGVNEYLLKPAGIDTIVPSVLKIKEDILAARTKDQQTQLRDSLFLENILTLRLQYINSLLSGGGIDPSLVCEKAKMLGIPLCGPVFQVVLLRERSERNTDVRSDIQLSMDLYHFTQGLEQIQRDIPQSFFCEIEENDYFWLLNAQDRKQADGCVQNLIRLAKQQFLPNTAFLMGIGSCVHQIQDISLSYAHAASALSRSTWDESGRVFFYRPVPDMQDIRQELNRLDCEIINAILTKKWSYCKDCISKAFSLCQQNYAPLEPLREICRHIMLVIRPTDTEQPLAIRDYHIDEIYYANDLLDWILSRIQRYSKDNEPSVCLPIVRKAVQYIHANYQRDITLQKLAKELFVTPNYLGRLFRQETGCKMSDYLNRFRIERAKELLKDSALKTSEIAEAVGFTSYKYFLVCFAKYADCNLREYRSGHGLQDSISPMDGDL